MSYVTVNIEEGMPLVDAAIRRATRAIKTEQARGTVALKIIHGYGSSGSGGRIRIEVRNYLARLVRRGEIKLFVPGEQLDIFDKDTQTLLATCREISKDPDLNRHNNGVTFVVL